MGEKPYGLDFLKRLGGHENKFLYFKATEFVPKIRNQKRTTTGFMRKVKMTKSFSNRKQFKTRAIRNITNPVGSENKTKNIPEWFFVFHRFLSYIVEQKFATRRGFGMT